MAVIPRSVLALDVGGTRIGVAVVSLIARLPRPLITLIQDETFFEKLDQIIKDESICAVVVGLPRGLQGQSTDQTALIKTFVSNLKQKVALPVYFQDEALTSKKAEAELEARGKPFNRGDIDALAATYILDDFMNEPDNLRKLEQ